MRDASSNLAGATGDPIRSGAREDARALFQAALLAVDPRAATLRHLRLSDGTLVSGGISMELAGSVVVLGLGKAAPAMVSAVEEVLAGHGHRGIVVTKHGHGRTGRLSGRIALHETGHPVPDAAGEQAALAVEQAVSGLAEGDLVIVCLSGGASALVPAPRPGITLEDKQATARLLLASGADIQAINTVRKKLSRLKGGGLARACMPAQVLTLALSDVAGDDWSIIGSGPTSPDPSSFTDALAVVREAGIEGRLPAAVSSLLRKGAAGEVADTPKPGDPCFARSVRQLLASNRQALDAAEAAAQGLGYRVVREPDPLAGEARAQGKRFARRLLELRQAGGRQCLLAGGETTVQLGERPGQGGRNQELALAAACELAGAQDLAVLAAGTDGTDGPTDAAGGLVDGTSLARAAARGCDAARHLAGHDAYPWLQAAGDLLITGPTGTNVIDLAIGLVRPG